MDRKKMIIILSSIVGIVVLLIGGFAIYSLIVGNNKSFESVENIMKNAAISYSEANNSILPLEDGDTVEISASDLISGGHMKDFSEYFKNKDLSCTGIVKITKNGEKYLYYPNLKCGDSYSTFNLSEYIKTNSVMKDDGSGYYEEIDYSEAVSEGEEPNKINVFKGPDPSNYVLFDSKTWKILSFDDNKVELVLIDINGYSDWDSSYNQEKDDSVGINNYKMSNARKVLYNQYNNDLNLTRYDDIILSHNSCVGKRNLSDGSLNGSIECSEVMEGERISTFAVYEILRASVDPTCTYGSKTCSNYNYLSSLNSLWTLNGNSANTYEVYAINGAVLDSQYARYTNALYPIIYITTNINGVTGTGTEVDPYVIPSLPE